MFRRSIILLTFPVIFPFIMFLGLCMVAFAAFVVLCDALEDPSFNKLVAGQSTGAEEEI